MGLMGASSFGFLARCFGAGLSSAGPKSWGAWCGVKPFAHQKKAQGFQLHSDYGLPCWEWGLWKYCISPSLKNFDIGYFSFAWNVGFTQLIFFPRGNCSICSCTFDVSMGGGEFKILLCCHPELEPKRICFYHDLGNHCMVYMYIKTLPI